MGDPTAIELETDPLQCRISGITAHGNISFSAPYITQVAENLWMGGCKDGLKLPLNIKHLVSLYPWEKYEIGRTLSSALYVSMLDSHTQDLSNLDRMAEWVNACRKSDTTLVHCQAGLNRSALVVARAIYLHDGWSGTTIMEHLRRLRSPAVLCNEVFADEVESWQ